jgi:mono/diheme cytochrome c family protein
MLRRRSRIPQRLATCVAALAALALLGGCTLKHPTVNIVRGKELFVQKCGACHTLAHANSTGTIGPNLDDAFREDRMSGFKDHGIQGLVDYWIQYPNSQGVMPAKLFSGQAAQDVAAYVAAVAAKPGQDTGQLAQAGAVTGTTPADGKLVFTGVGGCASCHTLGAASATGTVGPNLDTRLKSDCALPASQKVRGASFAQCIRTAIIKPYAFIPSGYAAGVMPPNFGQKLTSSEVTALVNFLQSAVK